MSFSKSQALSLPNWRMRSYTRSLFITMHFNKALSTWLLAIQRRLGLTSLYLSWAYQSAQLLGGAKTSIDFARCAVRGLFKKQLERQSWGSS